MKPASSPVAVLVIDMVNDFVTGVFGNARAQAIVPVLATFLSHARAHGLPVIYCNDSHLAGVDAELRVHRDHAIRGTWGAEITPALAATPDDYVVTKRRFSAFFGTELQALLGELGVTSLVLTGVATDGCVQHTAADAFFHGYGLTVLTDCVQTTDEAGQQLGLGAMERLYGAALCVSTAIELERLLGRSAQMATLNV